MPDLAAVLAVVREQLTLSNAFAVLYLVMLEGILSVDNALALAALVRGRLTSEEDRKKALHYGIIGAYGFRVAVIFAGVWLMGHTWVQWLAATYLIYLGGTELFKRQVAEEHEEAAGVSVGWLSPLWSTIVAVELMDIMFSVDSIAVALTVSDKAWVLIAGAVLGILAMRFTAGVFIKLISGFPILEKTAFVLVLFAGIKIVLKLCGHELPEVAFMAIMFGVIGASMALNGWYEKRLREPT